MKNISLLIGTILGTLLLVVAVAFMFSGDPQTTENSSIATDPSVAVGEARNVKTIVQDLGNSKEENEESTQSSELITIVEFSDFQCEACKNAAPLIQSVLEAFPGKVRLVYRHFPLDSIHPNARRAAIASEAVASINKDKFWDMHDLLFENQNQWNKVRSREELSDIFVTYVEKLDIDRIQFLERIEDNSVTELVENDSNIGTQLGVNSTPTFYVDGVKVSAPQLLATVKSLIVSTE